MRHGKWGKRNHEIPSCDMRERVTSNLPKEGGQGSEQSWAKFDTKVFQKKEEHQRKKLSGEEREGEVKRQETWESQQVLESYATGQKSESAENPPPRKN